MDTHHLITNNKTLWLLSSYLYFGLPLCKSWIFCVWLSSLDVVTLVVCGSSTLPMECFILWLDHNSLITSTLQGYSGGFQLLTLRTRTAMNTHTHSPNWVGSWAAIPKACFSLNGSFQLQFFQLGYRHLWSNWRAGFIEIFMVPLPLPTILLLGSGLGVFWKPF